MCAMEVSKGIGAGCPRSRIPDPFQIGGYVHHTLLMNQSERGFTASADPALARAPAHQMKLTRQLLKYQLRLKCPLPPR